MRTVQNSDAVVLFSGGMDSTIALYHRLSIARRMGTTVNILSISYGQRHSNELGHGREIVERLATDERYAPFLGSYFVHRIHMPMFDGSSLVGGAPVTQYSDIAAAEAAGEKDNAFVPYRNLLFLTVAAQYAYKWGAHVIVTGLRGGWPDCTAEFEQQVQQMLNTIVPNHRIFIDTPTHKPRAHCIAMAREFEGCMDALALSMTCFEGSDPPCGHCLPCLKRAQGFKEMGVRDPLMDQKPPR
jgi:7-cyano-7-deazaguanine synthase